jgi:hypothetical protein
LFSGPDARYNPVRLETQMQIPPDVREVVELRSTVSSPCKIKGCTTGIPRGEHHLPDHINHYLQEHQFRLLYIGQEHERDYEGKLVGATVAIVGK